MTILTYSEIVRAFLIGTMNGIAICIGYYLAIYRWHCIIDELLDVLKQQKECIKCISTKSHKGVDWTISPE